MKFIDIIKLSFNELKRKKNNLITILILTLVSSGIILGFSVNKSLNEYWENCTDSIVEYRTFMVFPTTNSQTSQEERIKKLKSYRHVVAVESPAARIFAAEVKGLKGKKTKYIDILGTVDNPVKIIKGESMENYNDEENVLICPKDFYPYSNENIDDFDRNRMIDLSTMVGKKINIRPIGAKKGISFKLVGIYDNTESNSRGDICYSKFSTVEKMNKKYDSESYQENSNIVLPNTVVIDNVRNTNSFMKELEKDDIITTGPIKKITVESGDKIISLITISTIVLLCISIVISILFEMKNFSNNKKEYGLLKSLGYSEKNIIKINDIKWLIIIIIVFLLSIILGSITTYIFHHYYLSQQILLKGIQMKISYIGIFLNIIISSIISLIVSIIFKKKLSKESSISWIKEL